MKKGRRRIYRVCARFTRSTGIRVDESHTCRAVSSSSSVHKTVFPVLRHYNTRLCSVKVVVPHTSSTRYASIFTHGIDVNVLFTVGNRPWIVCYVKTVVDLFFLSFFLFSPRPIRFVGKTRVTCSPCVFARHRTFQ